MSMFHRVVAIVWIASSATLLLACESREAEEQRREFVIAFVQSVYDGTDFYRQHLDVNGERYTQEARALMSREFRIIRRETVGVSFTSYEYYLKFSNGANGVLYYSEQKDARRAALSVSPGERHG